MVWKFRSKYVFLIFCSPTTINDSSQAALVFISCYFVYESKELYAISKTWTFLGHSYQYFEL